MDLPTLAASEAVAEDYAATGLSLQGHPVAFFRGRLARIGAIPARAHHDPALPQGARVTVAGLVLIRQRPGTAKGVVFLTLEDETGIANVIVWKTVFEANRRAAMQARFLAVRGRIQRAEGVVHLVAEGFRDLTDALRDLRAAGMKLPPETTDFGVPPDRRPVSAAGISTEPAGLGKSRSGVLSGGVRPGPDGPRVRAGAARAAAFCQPKTSRQADCP